jgi:hypothetical protein
MKGHSGGQENHGRESADPCAPYGDKVAGGLDRR